MSLYYEAADILANADAKGGSLKNRIFGKKDLKSKPGAIYAVVAETTKWSSVLKEVVEKSDILKLERKLTPTLALLLTHDLLLSKGGVAAPKQHALNLAVSKNKARLSAELTKSRIRRGFPTLEALKIHINTTASDESADPSGTNGAKVFHPRWIRVNTVKTTLSKAQNTVFKEYTQVSSLKELSTTPKGIYLDEHIPNLVAIQPGIDLSKHPAYHAGEIIFQDKASCFPAYLLSPTPEDKHVIDACAAPGNKTTHLAAILSSQQSSSDSTPKVTACERNPTRALTLQKMVKLAGANKLIEVKASQDFTRLKPNKAEFADVTTLLLDPSCSGSGIIGRDDTAVLHLPSLPSTTPTPSTSSKKRKRKAAAATAEMVVDEPTPTATTNATNELTEETADPEETDAAKLQTRLQNLSGFQLKIILHAFTFPSATKIAYSTCSIHVEENESVVIRALSSRIARRRGWKILKREEQPEGMRKWGRRGDLAATKRVLEEKKSGLDAGEVVDACIRCERGTEEGTMGFFVAGFVRDKDAEFVIEDGGEDGEEEEEHVEESKNKRQKRGDVVAEEEVKQQDGEDEDEEEEDEDEDEEEWGGFDD